MAGDPVEKKAEASAADVGVSAAGPLIDRWLGAVASAGRKDDVKRRWRRRTQRIDPPQGRLTHKSKVTSRR